MNLLQDPWMPVRDAQGRREWITPDRLAEPQWRAFDADRPDFNGALAQFAIGLLQTTTKVNSPIAWRDLYREPPTADILQQWFRPVVTAFELDGDGPRFMQDLQMSSSHGKRSPIAELLIETSGESGLEGNRDLFVKRNQIRQLCPACAATSLLTLQLNAPEGGRGHFTGLRGGGPLTTLVQGASDLSLWQQAWLNVAAQPAGGGAAIGFDSTWMLTFAWLAPIDALQKRGSTVTSAQVPHVHAFWAVPRRVRLDFDRAAQRQPCDICSRTDGAMVREFESLPNGLNYPSTAWMHPLTPYRAKDRQWLPARPNPNTRGYRSWLAWTLTSGQGVDRCAAVVTEALAGRFRQVPSGLRLWVFGYEMRKDKAISWHEGTLPLFALADCNRDARQYVQTEVARWIEGAGLAGSYLRNAVKDAWFGADARGDLSHVDGSFWSATEPAFYRLLEPLIERAHDGIEHPALQVRQTWHRTLAQTALRLFDESFVGAGRVERQNPRRIALAFQQLQRNLNGPKLKQALGLPIEASSDKPARKRGTARAPEAA